MRAAAEQQHYERAAWLRRRMRRLGDDPRATGWRARGDPRPGAKLVLAAHPVDQRPPGRVLARRGTRGGLGSRHLRGHRALEERTQQALRRGGYAGELGAHVPPDEIDELRIIATYLSSHPDLPQVTLKRREL